MLAGCSSLAQPNAPSSSKAADPFPADYKATIAAWLIIPGEQDVSVSEPRLADAWGITEARMWYVCVRRADTEFVAFLHEGRINASLPGPSPTYCTGAQYSQVSTTTS